MKILFLNLSALRFTVATPDSEPLGGSESALCYLARALSEKGHHITVIANLPQGTPSEVLAVRHFPIETLKDVSFFASEEFDAVIVCNAPAACAPLKSLVPKAKMIFWAHALCDQPAMHILSEIQTRTAIDEVVFVSAWQKHEVEDKFGAFQSTSVIGNGIAPPFENMFASAGEIISTKKNRAAYTSTPYRGLSVLVRAMDGFARPTKLDVFSSMKVYQSSDENYTTLMESATQNSSITLHGSLPQKELAAYLRTNAFLFYPSIYPETFCISVAEAMAAGMQIVSTNLGALAETTRGFANLVAITSAEGSQLVNDFRQAIDASVDKFEADPSAWAQKAFEQVQYVNNNYTWNKRTGEWAAVLGALS